jgi:hypothetical protein
MIFLPWQKTTVEPAILQSTKMVCCQQPTAPPKPRPRSFLLQKIHLGRISPAGIFGWIILHRDKAIVPQ